MFNNTRNAENTDPFAFQPPEDSVVAKNRMRAWWLRQQGYTFVIAVEHPYTTLLGRDRERVHYYFKAA